MRQNREVAPENRRDDIFTVNKEPSSSNFTNVSFERPHGTYFPKYRDSRVWTVHVDGSTDLGW
jgi:hypothetical protein